MKPAMLQQILATNCLVIQGLHDQHRELRAARAQYHKEADQWALEIQAFDDAEEYDKAAELIPQVNAWRNNAKILTKFIVKYKAKLKSMSDLQKTLKTELKHAQIMADWQAEDDAFWLEEARLAKEEGYADAAAVGAFLRDFEEE